MFGQVVTSDQDRFLKKQFGTRYIDKGFFSDSILNYNFSEIWTAHKINVDPDYFNPIRPEPLGFIGVDYQRLHVHILKVEKVEPDTYLVHGKSKVKNNICDFKGFLHVTQVIEFSLPYDERVEYVIDPREVKQGVLVGEYEFFEDSTQNHVGIFNGSFLSSFYLTKSGEVHFNTSQIFSDNYINNQFKGVWKPYSTGKSKKANWGDYRIPESGDLDIGAGGFSPADEYLKYGWQSYRNAYWSHEPDKEARMKEEEEWWK